MQAFLFTDIESSTRLWEEHPEAMSHALERHDAIMRDSITAGNGRLLKTTGDGAIAVFDSVSDAVDAAVAAQLELQAEDWETTPIRVRMGIHAGETLSRDEDHFGPVMNRAARIMASGHGGQVLLSEVAMSLAGAEISLADLGSHRLKDLTEPEHLYQVVHEGLPSDFPDLKTLDSRPNNLPLQATEFLGRSQELAAVHELLEDPKTRLLTLAGPGGAGKTRLGLQVAADLVDSFGDGVWFVDLAADAEPDDAFETVIRALSLAVSRTGSPLDVLKNRLRDREMLLVLDNFEQVVAAASGLAELLQSAPRLTVIVTSRETLRVRGEQVYAVPPLSLPDPAASLAEIADSEAVRLFVERAMATSPTFDLTADNAEAVARICMRLDGLPLAIELAAARLNLFTPADLLHRITDRLDVLASGGRDVPDRQRTLWGAIGWSYELLTDEERALFDAFAVFTGAELPAVEAVAADLGGAGFTLDTLSSLVDKSLVTRRDVDGSLRFGMLQMIKEFAADRLAADEGRQVVANEAHAVYYAGFAAGQLPRLESRDRQAALALLGADLDNLRTAWSYWVAQSDRVHVGEMLDPLWALHTSRGWYHGAIEMAGDMLDVIAADREPDDDAAELRLRTRLGRALMAVHGYNLEVEQNFSRALELTESVGTVQDRVPVLRALASYYLQSANIPTALKLGHQLFGIGEELGDEAVELEARGVIASSLLFMDVDTTLEHLEHVISRYDPAKHRIGYQLGPNLGVVARIADGIMLWAVGKLDSAVQRINDAVEFAAAIDSPYSLTWATYHEGYFAVSRGRFDEVLDASRRLAAVAEEHNYALWQALASVLEGVAITAMGDPETGVPLTEQSVTIYQGLAPPPIFWPLVLGLRASVHAMAGEMQEALDIVDEAVAIMGDIAPPELFVNRGDLLQATLGPEHPEVLETYQRGLAQARAFRLRLPELQAQTRLVRLRRALGHEDDGASELAALLETFKEGAGEADVMAARAVLEDAPS